jgi:GNAT superfamily N-acetyltransferase
MTLRIHQARPDELAWVNAQYARIDFVCSTEDDWIAVAEMDGTKAGIGRIVPVDSESGELGGMYVLQEFRGKSVARKLISFLLRNSPFPLLYCIPFAHLDGLYRGMGFEPVTNPEAAPRKVLEKYRWCLSHYPQPVSLLQQKLKER